MLFMFEKIASPKDSNRLPVVFNTWESVTRTNNSMNVRKNLKLFLYMPIGTRRSCLKEKTEDEKSRDTVPFSSFQLIRVYSGAVFTSRYIKKSTAILVLIFLSKRVRFLNTGFLQRLYAELDLLYTHIIGNDILRHWFFLFLKLTVIFLVKLSKFLKVLSNDN